MHMRVMLTRVCVQRLDTFAAVEAASLLLDLFSAKLVHHVSAALESRHINDEVADAQQMLIRAVDRFCCQIHDDFMRFR